MQSVIPPPPFLQSPGEPPIKWTDWFRAFNTYLGAIDGMWFRPERKKCLLLHSLGIEGQNILEHLPQYVHEGDGDQLDEFQETVKTLEQHFHKPPNLIIRRHQFFSREQSASESIDSYVTSLRVLAAKCEFRDFTEELIRDQLITRCYDKKVQERLLTCKNPQIGRASVGKECRL